MRGRVCACVCSMSGVYCVCCARCVSCVSCVLCVVYVFIYQWDVFCSLLNITPRIPCKDHITNSLSLLFRLPCRVFFFSRQKVWIHPESRPTPHHPVSVCHSAKRDVHSVLAAAGQFPRGIFTAHPSLCIWATISKRDCV